MVSTFANEIVMRLEFFGLQLLMEAAFYLLNVLFYQQSVGSGKVVAYPASILTTAESFFKE